MVFSTPGICENMKSMLYKAAMILRFLEQVASVGSLVYQWLTLIQWPYCRKISEFFG